ncbi:PASTA domain, binds beta-lactams, partial [Allochromatium warmingii]
ILGTVTEEYSATVPAGQVIRQDPTANNELQVGSAVAVWVSKGPAPVKVPDLSGQTVSGAQSRLANEGLILGTVTEEYSATVPAGQVIRQDPTANNELQVGNVVAIWVSQGPAPVSVPDLFGQTLTQAESLLTSAGLTLGTVTEEYSVTVPAGQVIRQTPTASSVLQAGNVVAIWVSQGPAPVSVPDLFGQTLTQAESLLTSAGLTLGTVTEEYSVTVPAGQVIRQTPTASSVLQAGNVVAIWVSKGPAPVSVPDLFGQTLTQAESLLTSVGLTLGTVTEEYSATVPTGQIIRQSPTASSVLQAGSAVAIWVSQGPAPVSVPDLSGQTLSSAESLLTSSGLTLGTVSEEYSATVPAGQIIRQSPTASSVLQAGSAVAIWVSKGPAPVSVPDLFGQTLTQAESLLTSVGLTLGTVTEEYSATVPTGQIIRQSPTANSMLQAGSAVAVWVSQGPAPVKVPDLSGQTVSGAQSRLANEGLILGTVTEEYSDTVPAGQVIRQDPIANRDLQVGSAVAIWFSKGPAPVSVPDLSGQTLSSAESLLTS